MDTTITTATPMTTKIIKPPLQVNGNHEINTTTNSNDTEADPSYPVFRRIAIYLNTVDPTGTLSFTYLTEGAANTIWLIRFSPSSNLYHHDSALVLRLRKNISSTLPMTILRTQFEERIAPLFIFDPILLLPMHLIKISDGIVQTLNAQLRDLEANRQRKEMRQGIYHPSFEAEPYAMLMPNLAHGEGTVIEFKPKWLVQSPSAPRDAQQCRTCALNAMRRATKRGSGRGDSGFCPFDLLSSHEKILAGALRQVWSDEKTLSAFVKAFRWRVQPALRQLQRLQLDENGVGLEDFRRPDERDFSVAMALRDCSVLLKAVVFAQDGSVQIPLVKFLDLDLKDASGGKVEKWAKMEETLIDSGWYSSQRCPEVQCAMAYG
ncbi:Inositol-pentakisphosphate 2-kinase [Neophaeococcomyces mojaviensis]|uniref:Inositol-pentakisphosphate 2-kinase n=1 Tax=Neophaeococcomyces mojaviensis TaxID=3383035 RepID=A0ACC3ABR7_9EURO|nr:Inositol-pentakisphosphate 2-kinase [Knufia sp. JES_112]